MLMCRKKKRKSNSGGGTGSSSKVLPATINGNKLREIRKKFGAESKEYSVAVHEAQQSGQRDLHKDQEDRTMA